MDWITGMQKAIDYTEAHITETTNYEEIAKQAYSSSFHFQRVFSILCGITLGDYIRFRRLSLAGEELSAAPHRKIIDIALKYGYDTPESFCRAFKKLHGISPSQARQSGASLKSFSRLSVKLTLDGGNIMDYRIETKAAFKVICRKKHVHKPQGDTATADISKFWSECSQNGTIEALCRYGRFDHLQGVLGICFSAEMADSGFPYGIGTEYNGVPVRETDFDIIEIPTHTYAVFPCKGKMPEAFTRTYQRICSEFFPQSNYEYGSGIELEVYPSAEVSDPNYSCEIWIAVNEKK